MKKKLRNYDTYKRNACPPGPHGPTDSEMSINIVIARQSRYEINSIQEVSIKGEGRGQLLSHAQRSNRN